MFASMLGFMVCMFIMFFLFMGLISGLALSSKDKEVSIKENSILRLDLNYEIPERGSNNPFENIDLGSFESKSMPGLNDVLKCIRRAADDANIKGIYLPLGVSPNSYATLEEIRNELKAFKKSKKFVVAYGELVDEHSYYLASVADKIYINPSGELLLDGMASNVMYLKNMFDKLGVEPQLIRHGKYKAAGEPLIAGKMSEENRTQIKSYLGSLFNTFVDNVAASRKKSSSDVFTIINTLAIQHPEDAQRLGIIDSLKYYDEVEEELKQLSSVKGKDKLTFVEHGKYKNVPDPNTSVSDNKVAVIYCTGDIVMGKGDENTMGSERIAEAIKKARTDEAYKAIVLRINSPGGSALASDIIWREVVLAQKSKPVVVSMGDLAASGGYYIAAPADVIVAQPNTLTGSIGVFGLLLNARELINNKLGIKVETVKFGEFADIGRADRPLTETERSIIQKGVDRIYNDFVMKVAVGRHMSREKVDSIGQGRVWAAKDAKQLGLVDELGGLDKALDVAKSKAKLSEYRIVSLPEQKDPLESLFSSLGENMSTWFSRQQLGEQYEYYSKMKALLRYNGIMARMSYDVKVE